MSKYTTGEMAKLTGVTVRTVQYYDTRNILIPSELSEGGRRLYSEEDLRKMKVICFLRELGLSIDSISKLLAEEDPSKVILLLLDQQEEELREELNDKKEKLDGIQTLKQELQSVEQFSVESIGDIAELVKNKNKIKKIRTIMTVTAIPVGIIQLATLVVGFISGLWWPFLGYLCLGIVYGILLSRYYYKNIAYICPQCHTVFRPIFKEVFFARHTPKTRKLTCTNCHYHGFCVETYGGNL